MINFSAHLGYQFTEVSFQDRFSAAAATGYSHVEFPDPYLLPKEVVFDLLSENSLSLVQIGAPQGGPREKGFAAMPGREEEFRTSIAKSIDYARHLNCHMVHPMSGCDSIHSHTDWKTYLENMKWCSEIFAENEITLLLEVMSLPTVKGYFLHSFELFSALKNEINNDNISLLFDTWHAQIIYGDIFTPLNKFISDIQHIQISDFPGRHEPGTGDIDFECFFTQLEESHYQGFVGCEYHPLISTEESINFMQKYQKGYA